MANVLCLCLSEDPKFFLLIHKLAYIHIYDMKKLLFLSSGFNITNEREEWAEKKRGYGMNTVNVHYILK